MKNKKISRRTLYDEVWTTTLKEVSQKYDIPYRKIKKICVENKIPTPPNGYWTKLEFGKDVSNLKADLEGDENEIVVYEEMVPAQAEAHAKEKNVEPENAIIVNEDIKSEVEEPKKLVSEGEKKFASKLMFMDEELRTKVLSVIESMEIKKGARLHKRLGEYKKSIENYRKKEKESRNSMYYNPRFNGDNKPPVYIKEVSAKEINRVIAILNALFTAIESLGGTINEDLSIAFGLDRTKVNFIEYQDKIPHELTKKEAIELAEYNDKVKHNSWATKPQIPKYDKFYNGRLRASVYRRYYYRDSGEDTVEKCISDLLVDILCDIEERRVNREKWEEKERLRREEEEQKKAFQRRVESEKEKTQTLVNEAEDYRIACEIRTYIKAVESRNGSEDWINWAKQKADWFDPTIAFDDELLGVREHSKSSEAKDLLKKSRYGNSYGGWF